MSLHKGKLLFQTTISKVIPKSNIKAIFEFSGNIFKHLFFTKTNKKINNRIQRIIVILKKTNGFIVL